MKDSVARQSITSLQNQLYTLSGKMPLLDKMLYIDTPNGKQAINVNGARRLQLLEEEVALIRAILNKLKEVL